MGSAALRAAIAGGCFVAAARLRRASWPYRGPYVAVIAWQALGLAWGISTIGALLAFGGHKGSTIALMVEILGAALTGGYFSGEFDWSDFKGAQTPKTGQLFIVIDPERGGNGVFRERVSEICELTREAGQDRLPGDRRMVTREKSLRDGIALSAADHQMLLSKLA